MGNAVSRAQSKVQLELRKVNELVTGILTKDGQRFHNTAYNASVGDCVANYEAFVIKDLDKQLKIKLQNHAEEIVLVPKSKTPNPVLSANTTKEQLCTVIAQHYSRILTMIQVIKHILNLEEEGKFSITGLCLSNIEIKGKIMDVHFCGSPHMNYSNPGQQAPETIDISQLYGLQLFAENLLDETERNVFANHLTSILNAKLDDAKTFDPDKARAKLLCSYPLLAQRMRKSLKGKVQPCSEYPDLGAQLSKPQSLKTVVIGADNPIFDMQFCYDQRVVKIDDATTLIPMYTEMWSHYLESIGRLQSILGHLVLKKGKAKYVLRDITKVELDRIEMTLKEEIAILFFRSLLDYSLILHAARAHELGMHRINSPSNLYVPAARGGAPRLGASHGRNAAKPKSTSPKPTTSKPARRKATAVPKQQPAEKPVRRKQVRFSKVRTVF